MSQIDIPAEIYDSLFQDCVDFYLSAGLTRPEAEDSAAYLMSLVFHRASPWLDPILEDEAEVGRSL